MAVEWAILGPSPRTTFIAEGLPGADRVYAGKMTALRTTVDVTQRAMRPGMDLQSTELAQDINTLRAAWCRYGAEYAGTPFALTRCDMG